MARPDDFDLARAIGEPSFTPARRDLPALARLIASADDATFARARAALVRADRAPACEAVAAALAEAGAGGDEAGAARLVAALGALAGADDGARALLLATLADAGAAPRARRAAAVALGKVGGDDARAALLARWDEDLAPDQRRAVAEALGKVGGDDAIARLRALDPGADAELARRRDRALLMAERTGARAPASEVAMDARPPAPAPALARCRAGLEDLLAAELAEAGIATAPAGPGALALTLDAPLATLWRARTLIGAGLVRPLGPGPLAAAIADALCADGAVALLRALTRGPIRWRLDVAGGGHRRRVVWDTARAVAARRPELVNDPTATTWDVVADPAAGRLELRPRRVADPRFPWRVRDVPSASHPTIAAALARVAGVRADDAVWDPFVGSGAELIERALAGPCARMTGSDLDPRALDAARANLAAAGVVAELVQADALALAPPGTTLIVTNPPLGRRLRGDAPALLERFAGHAARVLVPGGRLVWITPVPRRTERAARAAGLRLASRRTVDLGGFDAALERWDRP